MNVILIGSGGREHAIAWKLRQSPRLTDLHVAPGNAGTAAMAHNLDLPVPRNGAHQAEVDAYLDAIAAAARSLKVDLVFVAPDDPLSWGLVDRVEKEGIAAFGPSKAAARIEASKAWAKQFMLRHGIRHPSAVSFDDAVAARDHVLAARTRLVVKADGLATGKGALVTSSKEEALAAIEELMVQRSLGDAGARIVIEERISAREVSGHAFSDGRTVVPMPLSCDHKTVFEDGGPNTGGMGVYSPPWWADGSLDAAIRDRVLLPAVRGMADEGIPFKGILYPGVFSTPDGPLVFEFNARFGDPEAQSLLVRLESDLLDIAWACVNGTLDEIDVHWSPHASVCVVMASAGYPVSYETGFPISGLDDIDEEDVVAFHAGTRRDAEGRIVTAGGRVLGVTATGATLEDARRKAYANVERIHFDRAHYRRDIGLQE